MGSGLFYFGTDVEVEIGDVVRIRRFLRRPVNGLVSYIPGISPKHPQMDAFGAEWWGVTLESGTHVSWAYLPNAPKHQPKKKIEFIRRSDLPGLRPDEELL